MTDNNASSPARPADNHSQDATTPEPRRSLRSKKEVNYVFTTTTSIDKEDEGPTVPRGVGTKLADLASWSAAKGDDLAYLHRIVFGRPGTKNERRRNLSDFCGLDPNITTREKLEERIGGATKSDIVASMGALGLRRSGTMKELASEFAEFLLKPSGKRSRSEPTTSPGKKKTKASSPAPKKKAAKKPAAKKRDRSPDQEPESGSEEGSESEEEEASPPAKITKVAKAAAPKRAQPKQKHVTDEESPRGKSNGKQSASPKAATVPLPKEDDITAWVTQWLLSKTTSEVEGLTVKQVREAAEVHFALEDQALKGKKDLFMQAVEQRLTAGGAMEEASDRIVASKSPEKSAERGVTAHGTLSSPARDVQHNGATTNEAVEVSEDQAHDTPIDGETH